MAQSSALGARELGRPGYLHRAPRAMWTLTEKAPRLNSADAATGSVGYPYVVSLKTHGATRRTSNAEHSRRKADPSSSARGGLRRRPEAARSGASYFGPCLSEPNH
jgi:hypothetical protein